MSPLEGTLKTDVSALLEVAHRLGGGTCIDLGGLAEMMLASPSVACGGRSTLNNDGSPLELGITAVNARVSLRLIADPGSLVADGEERFQLALRVLNAVAACRDGEMQPLCDDLIARTLPADEVERAALPAGAMWIGVGLAGGGLALYTTSAWGSNEQRWLRARRWLNATLPDASVADRIIERLSPHALLISVGIEGTTSANARAKLYWRLLHPLPLRHLEIPLLRERVFAYFLESVIGDRAISRSGLVGSIGFRVDHGTLCDAKLDVCGHCVPRPPSDWVKLIDYWTRQYRLARFPIHETIYADRIGVAFIGLGLDTSDNLRLNVYLKA